MKTNLLIAILFSITLLTGCTAMRVAEQKVADAADAAAYSADETTCRRLTVGSVLRTHGKTKEGLKRWLDFCFHDNSPSRIAWDAILKATPDGPN